MSLDLDSFTDLVRARRTSLVVDPDREVPRALVERLCELALWAPNHKRSWPWRFALFTGAARAKLVEAFATDLIAGGRPADDPKVAKTQTKYLRAPAILVVGSAIDESKRMTAENRDAVAAGIEHVLLGATAAGLSSFWSSPPLDDCPTARALCDFETATQVVAVVYLGWPKGDVAVPARPHLHIAHVA